MNALAVSSAQQEGEKWPVFSEPSQSRGRECPGEIINYGEQKKKIGYELTFVIRAAAFQAPVYAKFSGTLNTCS